ncbi:MAG: type I-G CRISPR-associated RAMP protein Csb1/Cas7g [Phycisphaerales bacterium]
MADQLKLEQLQQAVETRAAAFRCRRTLQPAGGAGTKIFPPTYAGATYAVELRRRDGQAVPCVLIDSVQSQANRMEEALQQAVDDGRIKLPVVSVTFPPAGEGENVPKYPIGTITSLQAPHRLADAILRDSEHEGTPFRQSELGKRIDAASMQNATPLYELGPTALVFGMWDSTGPRSGLGAKFERAVVSEIVGINCPYFYSEEEKRNKQLPRRHGIRWDPLNISKSVGPVYMTPNGLMTLDPEQAEEEPSKSGKGTGKRRLWGKAQGKVAYITPPASDTATLPDAGKPSAANHGNVPYGEKDEGMNAGITVDYCEQTTTLSLIALRRLRFPNAEGKGDRGRDLTAQAVLAALGLCAAALAADEGLDLRSRCLLWPDEPMTWELLATPGKQGAMFELGAEAAVKLFSESVAAAKKIGLTWHEQPIELAPSAELVKLVARSQAFASNIEGETE